jgi:uncharacterized protein YndB with AHSA1/START domain
VINAPAHTVWKVIADEAYIADWFAAMRSSVAEQQAAHGDSAGRDNPAAGSMCHGLDP